MKRPEPTTASTKKILIVTGCGRSGSTILGICLGAGKSITNLGEVSSFEILEGRPNGAAEDSDSFRFWSRILANLRSSVGPNPDYFKRVRSQRRIYYSRLAFLPLWMGLYDVVARKRITEYREHLAALYKLILQEVTTEVVCDTTKNPARILNLIAIHGAENIYAIHLKRNPIAVAEAFSRPGSQTTETRAYWPTMAYYFLVNFSAALAVRRLPGRNRLSVCYEDFISQPDRAFSLISERLQTDLSDVQELVSAGKPLTSRYVFNGNRMRKSSEIVLQTRVVEIKYSSLRDRIMVWMARGLFGC